MKGVIFNDLRFGNGFLNIAQMRKNRSILLYEN